MIFNDFYMFIIGFYCIFSREFMNDIRSVFCIKLNDIDSLA